MRTIFFGTPELAIPSLAAIAQDHDIRAVVCPPDRPQKRSKQPVPPPVKVWAEEHGIPVHQPEKLNDGAFEAWLREQAPEICIVAAYGHILKQPILDLPPLGWLNFHPSLLPRWRGTSPIRTAILEGDEETGVSIMRLVLDMDAGDILLQQRTPIGPGESAAELRGRLAQMGAPLMAEAMRLVGSGEAVFTPQDPSQMTLSKRFEKAHGQIRWAKPARAIHNQVRACTPWPVAHCLYGGEVCRVHATQVTGPKADAAPGTITAVEKDRVLVATGEGQLAITKFQAPGKRAMDMRDFLRGHTMAVGDRLEEIT